MGAIHANGRGQMELPLSFLEPKRKFTATIYRDEDPDNPASKAVRVETQIVDSTTMLQANIPSNGGEAVRLVPAEN